jgi:hypothetical protein
MDDVDDITDGPHGTRRRTPSAARIPGHRYPTPTGEPCPRTIRVDGTIENDGNCQSCGTCLLYGGLVDGVDAPAADD